MRTIERRHLAFLAFSLVALSGIATAQDLCDPCSQQSFRLEPCTVLQPQTVEVMRPVLRTEYVEQPVTRYRPVVRTKTEMREYRVAKPIVETSYREERFTVWKPIVETSYRDEQYQQTDYVTETSEREEQFTTYRPVTETQVYQRTYAVQRPVTETRYYQQQYRVNRPVYETQMRTQQYTTLRPQTQVFNQTVDAGGYVPQTTVTPGSCGYGLSYKPDLYAVPGPLGIFARVRGGNVLAPHYTPPTAQTQYVYRPNLITQQVARTSYQPVTEQVQVPVQVQRIQSEVVTQNVPVQSTRMQTEYRTENVPVQTTRMVPTTMVRKVPYVVSRPVTRTMTRKVPVTQQRWVTEERVRKVPVQSTRMTYEMRREPVTVNYTEYESYTQMVRRPVTRQVYVPHNETRMVPTQVVQRVPFGYYDAFSAAIVGGYPTIASNPVVSSSTDNSFSILSQPEASQPRAESEMSLKPPAIFDEQPRGRLERVESSLPDDEYDSESPDSDEIEFNGNDEDNLPAPAAKCWMLGTKFVGLPTTLDKHSRSPVIRPPAPDPNARLSERSVYKGPSWVGCS